LIGEFQKDSIVIPRRATYQVLDKRYVFVVGKDNVARQREIVVQAELDDLFVVKTGVEADEKIIIEGTRRLQDGDKVEFDDLQ
jgi:membrane fusion protein (multidrug efflux system)